MDTSQPRPRVTVSYAQTLDGRIATRDGSSQWISGPEALAYAHRLRAAHDAIMVGIGTVLRDDPRLTVRFAAGRDPVRVVVDSTLRIPLDAAVLRDGAANGTVLATTEAAPTERSAVLEELAATVLTIERDAGGGVSLAPLLAALAERGITSVMVEGGARLITSLLRARLVDRVAVCVAPKILGAGIEAVGDLGVADLDAAVRLTAVRVASYGADLMIEGDLVYPDAVWA